MNINGRLVRSGLLLLILVLFTACGKGGGGITGPTLNSLTISPSSPTLKVTAGHTLQLTATGHYSNVSTTQDLTATVAWASSDPNILVSAGQVSPAASSSSPAGSVTITATSGSISGSVTVSLMPDSFAIGNADPLAPEQWHLKNTGQAAYADAAGSAGFDINVEPVYSTLGYTGYGVNVAVVDTGLEILHEDLAANVLPNGSWNFTNNTSDPTNTADTTGDHGTSVAGLIASQAFNGKGGMGVASEARLKGFNFLNPDTVPTYANYLASIGGSTASPNSSDVAIFNQSYGSSDTLPISEHTAVVAQYAYGVTSLRGGKGALYVKAAGNNFDYLDPTGAPPACAGTHGFYVSCNCKAADQLGISCENANFDPDNVLPYNIVVGALNAAGIKSSYSTTGSAIWVTAPGGEYGANESVIGPVPAAAAVILEPAMITTDQSGCTKGYSQTTGSISAFDNHGAGNTNCSYTSTFNGTSSATPVTAGVIALMLQANPNLTWRDVKHILASTARQVAIAPITVSLPNPAPASYTAEPGWITNAANYKYHNWYGFGLVDASAAVAMAGSYAVNLGTFTNTGWLSSGTISVAIPDSSVTGVTNTINVATALTIEAVQIEVSATHSYTGDLGIELTSPSGTQSILKNIRDGFTGTDLSAMLLESNAFYGETGIGTWTIKVVDGNNTTPSTNTTGGILTNWQIRIYGH
jgi:subtilisin family serine protease